MVLTITKILLDVALGVIVTDKPVSANVLLVVRSFQKPKVPCTTCKDFTCCYTSCCTSTPSTCPFATLIKTPSIGHLHQQLNLHFFRYSLLSIDSHLEMIYFYHLLRLHLSLRLTVISEASCFD